MVGAAAAAVAGTVMKDDEDASMHLDLDHDCCCCNRTGQADHPLCLDASANRMEVVGKERWMHMGMDEYRAVA